LDWLRSSGRRLDSAGYRGQEGDFVAVLEDGIALGELLVYGDVESAVTQGGDAAVEEIAYGGGLG